MVKDRMPDLIAAQRNSSMSMMSQVNIDMEQSKSKNEFMAEFFRQVESVQTYLNTMQSCLAELTRLHTEALSLPNVDSKLSEQIEERMIEIRDTALKAKEKLKEMHVEANKRSKSTDFRIKKNQILALSDQYNTLMNSYYAMQVSYKEKSKKLIKRQLEIIGQSKDDEEIDNMIETGNTLIYTEGVIGQTEMAKKTLADIEARHKDLIEIEKSIKQLNEMFIDMALLVETQGELVDNIEVNVDTTEDLGNKIQEDIKRANEYNKSARKKKLIIAGIIAAVIVVILIIVAILLAVYLPKPQNQN